VFVQSGATNEDILAKKKISPAQRDSWRREATF
jgi:hypothetical protein